MMKLVFFACWILFLLGHGPIHLLIQSVYELGFFWDSEQAGWIRPGLPPLRMMTGPIQHFRTAIWQAWQHKVATDLCKRKGFRGGFGFDFYGSHQLLVFSHFRERDKMLLRAIVTGGVLNGFLLAKLRKKKFLVGFVVLLIMMAIFFGTAPFLLLLSFVISLSFFLSWVRIALTGLVVFFGMVGFLVSLSRTLGTTWAISSSDLASSRLENALRPYPLFASSVWHPFWDQNDAQYMADDVLDDPNIWTDGSREPIPHLDIEIAGAGAFIHSPAIVFDSHHWSHFQDLDDLHESSSHIFAGIPGPIQSVQRAEYWGVILALQTYSGIHVGIDNLNVLRGVAALLS